MNPRASAKESPRRQERSQEGVVAESPVTQGLGRVLRRDQEASGACGNGHCQENEEAGRGFGGLRWCQGGEETDKSLKNFGGKGDGRGRQWLAVDMHGRRGFFRRERCKQVLVMRRPHRTGKVEEEE